MKTTLAKARSAKRAAKERFGEEPNIVGIGIGENGEGYCLKVNLAQEPEAAGYPESIAGVPVVYAVVGRIVPLRRVS